MSHNSGSASNQAIFQEQKVSFEDLPHQTKLFVDFQNDSTRLDKFYPNKNKDFNEFSKEVLQNYEVDRETLCDVLLVENKRYGVGRETIKNIQKLRDSDCVAVLTGQQAGLFSGPAYTIYKALSCIKLAEDLTKQGIKAVPIFWIASEDHDFDEISKTYFINKKENLHEAKNSPSHLTADVSVGNIEIEDNIKTTINALIENLDQTEFTSQINKWLNSSYNTDETFSSSFGKLMAELFGDYGLIFVSPLNNELRKLSSPIYKKAIENFELIKDELLQRDVDLKRHSYHSQVLVEEDFFPFFYIGEDNRRYSMRFDTESKRIKSQNSAFAFEREDLLEIAEKHPSQLSPNALMRPVVQDYLFPTICYFGGGAEIAYFGQNSVIYETLERPVTPIRHRSSFTIIRGKDRRNLNKYGLTFNDVFSGKNDVLAGIVEKFINNRTSAVFDDVEETLDQQLDKLRKNLIEIDPTLSDNLVNRKKKIDWHINTLRKKFHKAEILRNDVMRRRVDSIFTGILPKDVLQERNINFLYFLNIYGENLLDWLYDCVKTDETKHQIIIF